MDDRAATGAAPVAGDTGGVFVMLYDSLRHGQTDSWYGPLRCTRPDTDTGAGSTPGSPPAVAVRGTHGHLR